METINKISGFKNKSICSFCGGICCKKLPGACYPDDFKSLDKNSLVKLLKHGNYAIDYYESFRDDQPNGYYIRPKIKWSNRVIDPSWGGECIFLTKKGCKLRFENRPTGCRYLEPGKEECNVHGKTKLDAANEWYKQGNILNQIIEEINL